MKCLDYAIAAIGFATLGCASPPPHAWATPGSDREISISTAQWDVVPPYSVLSISPGALATAIGRLADRDWIELMSSEVREFEVGPHCAQPEGVKPYLVRGVAYGESPWFSVVRQEPSVGWIAVYHGTYNGENLLLSAGLRHQAPLPVIVFLPRAPMRVLAIAEVGGDHLAARGLRYPRATNCAVQQGDARAEQPGG